VCVTLCGMHTPINEAQLTYGAQIETLPAAKVSLTFYRKYRLPVIEPY
jgi:hypothetical protein